jgi:hypothetical protein
MVNGGLDPWMERAMPSYVRAERVVLKTHPEYNEKWVQARIAEDPKILGLGDLILLQQERIQPTGGRLDLLFQDNEKRRYELELQLGVVDESHIIRTIEYWDIEKKRYPQYDHCAVLVAEDVTSRFLNIVSLFNGSIPLIAIQMQAYRIEDKLTLIFTTVMDEMRRGLVDEDEGADAAPTDRAYWEKKASRDTVGMVDQLLGIVKQLSPDLQLKYNKFYISLTKNDRPYNFMVFEPRKKIVVVVPRILQSEENDRKIEEAGLSSVTPPKFIDTLGIY